MISRIKKADSLSADSYASVCVFDSHTLWNDKLFIVAEHSVIESLPSRYCDMKDEFKFRELSYSVWCLIPLNKSVKKIVMAMGTDTAVTLLVIPLCVKNRMEQKEGLTDA